MLFNPYFETLPLKKLRYLQTERLKKLVAYVYEKVPFYRRQLDERNLKPADIQHIEDIHKLPFTRKDDLREHYPFGLFAVPLQQIARIHASSGTTGKPTVVGYTKADLELFAEVNARSLAAAGAEPGMMLHNAYGYGLFTGGLGLHAGAGKLGMTVVPVSGGMTDRQLRLLQDFKPDVISCTPSYAQRLIDEIRQRGISLTHFNLKFAVCGAEPWSEVIRKDVQQGLGVRATNIYGLSEVIGPGVSQEPVEEQGAGCHIWEDHFFPEVVDRETGEPLPEGQDGVLVFTTLTKQAFPVLRYWTNDICSLHYDPDSQRSHIKMSWIKGRADDMLIIRGVNFFPTQIESVLEGITELAPHYQVLVTREDNLDKVSVKIELAPQTQSRFQDKTEREKLARFVSNKIKDTIGINMRVALHDYGDIPRSEGGKLSRIIDNRRI